ncbi:hypothetical protein PC121_g17353 [Phytophthora cactorum]|nr:hypothetical protein PC121_g17353 [Phytophthora cactorum]
MHCFSTEQPLLNRGPSAVRWSKLIRAGQFKHRSLKQTAPAAQGGAYESLALPRPNKRGKSNTLSYGTTRRLQQHRRGHTDHRSRQRSKTWGRRRIRIITGIVVIGRRRRSRHRRGSARATAGRARRGARSR